VFVSQKYNFQIPAFRYAIILAGYSPCIATSRISSAWADHSSAGNRTETPIKHTGQHPGLRFHGSSSLELEAL
jgi:hypothetical protein